MHNDPSELTVEERLQLALQALETLTRACNAFWLEAPEPASLAQAQTEVTFIRACQGARALLLSEEREVPV